MKICECCNQIIDDKNDKVEMSSNEIIVEVSTLCEQRFTDVISKSRNRKIVEVRYMIFDLLYQNKTKKYTLNEIGKMFGGIDHSTLIHGINKVKILCSAYPEFKNHYLTIHQKIYGHTRFFRYH